MIFSLIAGIPAVFSCSALAASPAEQVLGSTFKLYNAESTATCFLVQTEAPDSAIYVATAAHVLESAKGDTSILVLREGKADGSFARRDWNLTIRREGKPVWTKHPQQDVAVLRLTETPPVPTAALPFSLLADEAALKASGVHICSPLFILTYPQRHEANSAGFPVARQGIFASPPLLPIAGHPTFQADFTTFSGDSGGPVFITGPKETPLIVGLVLAQMRHDEKVKTEYEESTLHHPLGLGQVLHAHYLRETITEADRAASGK